MEGINYVVSSAIYIAHGMAINHEQCIQTL